MKRREIGSHFEWADQIERKSTATTSWLPDLGGDSTFTFSGRNAIDLAIQDMKSTRNINTVYMPSYACDSMTDPFSKHGIEILYYDVTFEEGTGLTYTIDPDTDCDIFFAMSHFGLGGFALDAAVENFQTRGTFILEDITHRLLSEEPNSPKADYAIASLRKWFAIPSGGYITKRDGELIEQPKKNSDTFVEEKIAALHAKQAYLNGEDVNKQAFLNQFGNAEQTLKTVDATYKIDGTSFELLENLDIAAIQEKRRKNAAFLYAGIKQFEEIQALIPEPDFTTDCPLFVPVMLPDTETRDDLRKKLIENQIYCPVHWPQREPVNNIWTRELSLICDQRYTEEDMNRILSIIDDWHSHLGV